MRTLARAPERQLCLWHAWLNRGDWPGAHDLPAPERERAERIVRRQARRRWVESRWALRAVLGRCLGGLPEAIELETGEHGKPQLADPDASLRFNLSHSDDVALIAVTWGREVGVDVERIVPRKNLLGLARRGLAPAEAVRIEGLVPEERLDAFYAAWTRREATTKCHGVGLGAPLPEEPVAVASLDIAPGYAAAVAVTGEELPTLRRFELGDAGRAFSTGGEFRSLAP